MSAGYWMEIDTGGREPARISDDHDLNITYNCGPQLRACGFPEWGYLIGKNAGDTIGLLSRCLDYARDPFNDEELRKLDPKNGWGSLDRTKDFLWRFLQACIEHPKATIGGWL